MNSMGHVTGQVLSGGEGARYRKLARSRGEGKAQVALGNTQLRVYHKLLSNPGMHYQDPRPGPLRTPGRPPPQDRLPRPRDPSPRPRRHPHPPRPEPGPDGPATTQAA